MKKSAATKAAKKNEQNVADLAPNKAQNVNGGFVMRINKASPK